MRRNRPRGRAPACPLSSHAEWALIGLVTLVGLVLRLPGFGDSLFADELSSYFLTGHSAGQLFHLLNGHSVDLTPPLYFLIAGATRTLAGNSVQSIRLISLLAGTAAIPLTYLLGRLTLGRRAALVAMCFIALTPYLIYYSTEARAYALLLLISLGSTLALLRALDSSGRGWWFLYVACACGTLYTHYTGIFVLVVQFAWAFLARPAARRRLTVATGAAAIGFLPWLPTYLKNASSPGTKAIGQIEPFTLSSIRIDLGRWLVGRPYVPLVSEPGRVAIALIIAGFAVAAFAVAARVGRRGRLGVSCPPAVVLLLMLALATPVGLALYSLLGTTVWDLRDLIASWPAVAVALAGLLTAAPRPARWVAVALCFAGLSVGGIGMARSDQQRPDYLDAARLVDRIGAPQDPVVEVAVFTPGPLTEMETALFLQGRASAHLHPVLRLGLPPLNAVLHAPPYATLPRPPGALIAREAQHLAPQGPIFLVGIGRLSVAELEHVRFYGRRTSLGPTGFLQALSPRLKVATVWTFTRGFLPVSVYVFRAAGSH